MRIIDISRDLFSTPVYPGDPLPRRELVRRLSLGEDCEVSAYYAGCHSATHMDAPSHFLQGGGTVESIPLQCCIGPCTVVEAAGIVTGEDIDRLLSTCEKRLLLKGGGAAWLSQSAAFALADAGFVLVGTDAQSIAPPTAEAPPHTEFLSADIAILEGLELSEVEPGDYTLCALPILLAGAEAAPVRAVLIEGG